MFGLINFRRVLPFMCIAFSMIALVYPTQDDFVMRVGNETRIITRAGEPGTYWAGEAVLVLLAAGCFVVSLYLQKR